MADALLASTVEVLVEKAINLASDEIGLFFGFKKDLEKLKKTLTRIQAVLRDAERKQVTEESVKLWLGDLERVAFDADNLLDDFNYEMIRRKVEIQNQVKRKVCFFFSLSNPIAFRCKMANKIQKINMDLISISEQASELSLQHIGAKDAPDIVPPASGGGYIKNRETDSLAKSLVGRGDDVSAIVRQLTAPNNNETLSVLPIVGMGGIGKTALAQNVFADSLVEKHFEKRMWVCVSDDFNANRLFGLMLESLKSPMPGVEGREAKVIKLKELLDGQRCLLVLDDVWNEEFTRWKDFFDALNATMQAMGSWILVTTREQSVAGITRISSTPYNLNHLSNNECWVILQKIAFDARVVVPNGLRDIGLNIAEGCQGLPLAAVVFGGTLRNKKIDEWQKLESELQSLGRGRTVVDVVEILKLSFYHLPYLSLKKCFAYCSIFPKNFQMERNELIQLWAAEGFLHPRNNMPMDPRNNMCMEEVGNMYFTILLDSNLFQDAEEDEFGSVLNCKIHDHVHDMLESISNGKTFRLTDSSSVDKEMCPIRYLALERSGEEMPFPSTESFECTTTLFLLENKSLNDREISFFMLRVLKLRSSSVKELPKSIGKLSHLRYLDLSDISIITLSDSLCKFYNLQTLRVRDCQLLTKFPNNFKNLVNLRHFELRNCQNCKELPTLGHMPSLKFLHLEGLDGITSIGSSFYGESAVQSGSSNQKPIKLFPVLEHLILENMLNLSEWMEAAVYDGALVMFPALNTMTITNCLEIATFPSHFECLKKLHVRNINNGSTIMTSICSRVSTLTNLCIEDVNGLIELPNMLFQNNPKFEHLTLNSCPDLTQFLDSSFDVPQTLEGLSHQTVPELSQLRIHTDNHATQHLVGLESLRELVVYECHSLKFISIPRGHQYLTALQKLILNGCGELTHLSIPQISESELGSTCSATCPSLEELVVQICPNLISFSIDLTRTPSLSVFVCLEKLTDLPKQKLCSLTNLRALLIGPFSETTELHSFLRLFDTLQPPHPYLPFLSELALYGWPHWESLPQQLQHLSALTTLWINGFGVKSLPDWFGKLSLLEKLVLWDCKKLENLPSHQSMRSLTRLRKLWIQNSPLLKERCKLESSNSDPNSEWSKISHIPEIGIYI